MRYPPAPAAEGAADEGREGLEAVDGRPDRNEKGSGQVLCQRREPEGGDQGEKPGGGKPEEKGGPSRVGQQPLGVIEDEGDDNAGQENAKAEDQVSRSNPCACHSLLAGLLANENIANPIDRSKDVIGSEGPDAAPLPGLGGPN